MNLPDDTNSADNTDVLSSSRDRGGNTVISDVILDNGAITNSSSWNKTNDDGDEILSTK